MYRPGRDVVRVQRIFFGRPEDLAVGARRLRAAHVEDPSCFSRSILLEITVHQPHVGVPARRRHASRRSSTICRDARRPLVCRNDVVPHACGEIDVRGHVERVRRRRRDREVPTCRGQTTRCVNRIVVRVNQVVGKTRMVRMRRERFFEDGRGLQVDVFVATVVRGPEQRQPVERGCVHVVRVCAVHCLHGVEVGEIACVLVAGAVQIFYGGKIRPLACGTTLRDANLTRRSEPIEDSPRAAEILFHPHGMVLRHRLAPVGHGEIGIGLLRGTKRPCRVVVLEVVELGEPVVEALLRSRCAGVGEVDVADAADSAGRAGLWRLGAHRRGDEHHGGHQAEQSPAHRVILRR